jgi:hypothetical protein
MFTEFTTRDLLDCLQLLHICSSTMKMGAVTTLDDSRPEFPTAQLEDEPVFKGGRDGMASDHGPEAF